MAVSQDLIEFPRRQEGIVTGLLGECETDPLQDFGGRGDVSETVVAVVVAELEEGLAEGFGACAGEAEGKDLEGAGAGEGFDGEGVDGAEEGEEEGG